jgi:dihydrofolate reductase
MFISIIVAAAENNAIGKNNQMLWHLPEDFKYFKNKTWGLPVLMGRRTFQAINGKPLPGRLNIVLTRDKKFSAKGVIVVNKIDNALFLAQEHDYNELMIIGGADIYKQMLPKAHRFFLTRVAAAFDDADAFFPELNVKEWQLVSEDKFLKDAQNMYDYSFQVWERKA